MLEEIKEEIDLESFFTSMGVTKIRRSSDGYSMRCLHPNHNDSGPSFHYKTTSHKFFCYGCHFRGDIIDIVKVVKGLGFFRAISWLKEFGGWSASVTTKQLEAILERRQKQKSGEVDDDFRMVNVVIPAYFKTDFSLARDSVQSYVKKRGWDLDVLANHGVGYCKHGYFRDRIVFPVHDRHNQLLTFAARATWILSEDEERYLYPRSSVLSKSIWPIDKPMDGIPIFVEGCPDALRLREYGYNAYACLGNQLGDNKLGVIREAFKGHDRIIILPDADKGGDQLFKWFGRLVYDFLVDVCRLPVIYYGDDLLKDVDEIGLHYGRKKIDEIIENKIPYQDVLINQKYNFPKAPKIVTTLVKDLEEVDHSTDPLLPLSQLYWSMRC